MANAAMEYAQTGLRSEKMWRQQMKHMHAQLADNISCELKNKVASELSFVYSATGE